MSFEVYTVFFITVFVVMVTPGPSTVLGAVQGMTYGTRAGVFTAFGDISANFLQMVAAVAGLGLILAQSVVLFTAIKIAGVLYLAYIGIKMIRSKGSFASATGASEAREERSAFSHYRRGFYVAGTSPKAILFYGALFPQFINPEAALLGQFALMSLTCMIVDFIIVVCYSALAARSADALLNRGLGQRINRIGGGMMLGASALLATQK